MIPSHTPTFLPSIKDLTLQIPSSEIASDDSTSSEEKYMVRTPSEQALLHKLTSKFFTFQPGRE
jgi:hypothetical protein